MEPTRLPRASTLHHVNSSGVAQPATHDTPQNPTTAPVGLGTTRLSATPPPTGSTSLDRLMDTIDTPAGDGARQVSSAGRKRKAVPGDASATPRATGHRDQKFRVAEGPWNLSRDQVIHDGLKSFLNADVISLVKQYSSPPRISISPSIWNAMSHITRDPSMCQVVMLCRPELADGKLTARTSWFTTPALSLGVSASDDARLFLFPPGPPDQIPLTQGLHFFLDDGAVLFVCPNDHIDGEMGLIFRAYDTSLEETKAFSKTLDPVTAPIRGKAGNGTYDLKAHVGQRIFLGEELGLPVRLRDVIKDDKTGCPRVRVTTEFDPMPFFKSRVVEDGLSENCISALTESTSEYGSSWQWTFDPLALAPVNADGHALGRNPDDKVFYVQDQPDTLPPREDVVQGDETFKILKRDVYVNNDADDVDEDNHVLAGERSSTHAPPVIPDQGA